MKKLIKDYLQTYRYKQCRIAWNKRHKIVFKKNPELNVNVPAGLLKDHLNYWKPLGKKFSTDTFKICFALSGVEDPAIIPEELYQGYIEPKLRRSEYQYYFSHKSLYPLWNSPSYFPESIGHKINGFFYDKSFRPVSLEQLVELSLNYDGNQILKPSIETYGGKGVTVISKGLYSPANIKKLLQKSGDFVLQEKIKQHKSLKDYHHQSLNTIRVHLMRDPLTGKAQFLHAAMKMGCGGGLDNLSAGGIISYINQEGKLYGKALDKYAKKYYEHPDSGLAFDLKIPDYEGLQKTALSVMGKIFYVNIIGLDMAYSDDNKWKVIEVNTQAQSIRFVQYAGVPFMSTIKKQIKNI